MAGFSTGRNPRMEDVSQVILIEPDYEGAAKVLREYKNRYEGQRCFIIGNGPSLKAADLDKIKDHGDFSIASNRIYLIFKETNWRPNVWTSHDMLGIKASFSEMSAIKAELKITPVTVGSKMYPLEGALPVRYDANNANDWMLKSMLPLFSDDIARFVHNGMTITYVNIQIAAYLGFKEMVLLGMDHSYSRQSYIPNHLRDYDWNRNKLNLSRGQTASLEIRVIEGVQDHFCANYMDGIFKEGAYCIEATVRAYQAAKRYGEEHGIRIVNATRGGKLNVFKRVNFDELFEDAGRRNR